MDMLNENLKIKTYGENKVTVADLGFSWGGGANSQSGYYFAHFVLKTAWKWKNLDPEEGMRPWRPLGSVHE